MFYTNKPIKYRDVELWIKDFQRAKKIVKDLDIEKEAKNEIINRLDDALFLTAYAESTLKVAVSDEVYERAVFLQRESMRGEE